MESSSNKFNEHIRIIWAIALKDIGDAIRNKTTLSIMIGAAFVMLSSMALPLLLGLESKPAAIIYSEKRSSLVSGLAVRDEFRLHLADSEQEMQDAVGESATLMLGLTLPPEFHQAAGSGETVQVDGIIPHWADPAEVDELVAFFESELEKASWQRIQIDVEGHVAYPATNADGQPFMLAMNLSLLVLLIGLSLVPHLLVEEKETHTFEVLMVSPARFSQIVIGKAITGLFYCLCAAAIVFALRARLFVHWDVILLAVILGSAFAVAAGLLIGALSDNPTTINLWMSLAIIGLLVPVLLEQLSSSRLPAIVRAIIPWIPSVTFSKLIVFSMAGDLSATPVWANAAALAAAAIILLGIVVWRVRRSDR